jgi:hypothetical protein
MEQASTPAFGDEDRWTFYRADGFITLTHSITVDNGNGKGWTFVFVTTLYASRTPSYSATLSAIAQ